jgi:xylan 1,4-beta-xylosidase
MGTTLEFISYHAKGSPAFRDGHVVMGISHELQDLEAGFAVVAGFPELKHTPIVIGECDPDGCAACSEDFYPQNAYRDGALYASYTAASFARAQELAVRRGVRLEGTLTWAFEFEGQPWFAGFRALASNGVELPVLNAFRMMAMMRGQKVSVENSQGRGLDHVLKLGVRADPDVGAMASRDGDKVWVLVWHYHDEDVPGPDAKVKIEVDHLKSDATKIKLRHYRVDASHSNAYAAWKKMGSPQPPSPAQVTELERRAGLEELAGNGVLDVKNGAATIEFELPRQGVSLLVIGDDPAPVKKESFGKKLWRKVKFW